MNIIYRKPLTGKTIELIKKSAKEGGYICCLNSDSARIIFNKAKEMGLSIPYPITHKELLDEKYYWKGI